MKQVLFFLYLAEARKPKSPHQALAMTASPDEEMLILQKKYYIQLLMPKEAPIAVSTEMAILRIIFHVSFLIIIVSYALKIYVSVVTS